MRKLYSILLFAPLHVFANEVDSLAQFSYTLESIVIQSSKQDKKLKELPQSVSQITGTAIRNQQIVGIKEFSGALPNLYMPDYGSKYTSPVFIRGIGAKSESPSVGLYIDGLPVFEKSAFDFEFTEVERIDVLRGPQGTLYGRNTMGGLIEVYTRSPLKHQGTQLSGSVGSYDRYQFTGSHYGRVNQKFGYAVAASYKQEGGMFTNQYTGKKADDMKSGNGRLRLEWNARPYLKLALTSVFDRSMQGANAYAPFNLEDQQLEEICYNRPSSYQRTFSLTGFTLDYTRGNTKLSYRHSLQYLKDKLRQDQDFTAKDRVNSDLQKELWLTSGELNLKTSWGKHYRALVGAFGFYQQDDKDVNTYFSTYETLKVDDIPTYGVALYHQSVIDHLVFDGLSLTLGVRYDYERATRDYQYFKDGSMVKPLDGKMNFSQLVPKAALQYTFPCSGQIYASVSKGYKTGGFNTSFNHESEKNYGPESSWNYEIGAKHPFLDKLINAEVALFWIDWRNQQLQEKVDAGGFMIKNAGKSVSRGVEFSLQCNPCNGLMIGASYGFTDARFKRYHYSDKIDYSGKRLPLVPRHTVGGNINYTRSLRSGWIDRYQVGMSFSGNGRIYWKEDNAYSQPFYALLNATASVTKGKCTLGIWAKNLTQTHYVSYLFQTSSGYYGQPGKPFTMGAKFAVSM